ncbi:LysR substrate-binding domain-containing protein [Hydrogenophaga laconesensis]|uniref:LysR family nitrogen assimilation transcriptional regulator n=1 Tax=Hydrogenophaga laconesensis TaxID=1805971 RepID=A0ABU1VFX5_9BURK|nr:LysR substrate-binding domain-containing protein [Hydrogenophaga laconesensis]MDR7096230.1 LysR family nitrogen assimilation transcriptional regulator [Hydrogenophaga laconesensis]
MEIRQLKYFVRIVELGSVSRAAADLFIAQPALSHQMSNLEEELKVKLLSRSVRGVSATEAGEVFYRHARAMLRQMDRMRTDVQHAGDYPQGLVSVGLPSSAATLLAPPLIAEAATRYPDIQLQITESLSGHLEELVVNGRIEMSLLFDPLATDMGASRRKVSSHLDVRPLLVEDLFLLSAHGVGAGDDVSLAQAASCALALPGRSNVTRQIIDAAFQSAGLDMRVIAELDSLATIRAVVASGVGATIGSASIPGGTAGLRIQRVTEPALQRRLSLCTFDIVPLSSAAHRIVELISEVTARLVSAGQWPGASPVPQP